jgi:protein-tyrosine phosphatase
VARKNNRNRHGGKWKDSRHAKQNQQKQSTYKGGTTTTQTTVSAGNASTVKQNAKYTKWCTHYQQPFDLGDGEVIFASAYQDSPMSYSNYGREIEGFVPDVGFYLDSLWSDSRSLLVTPGSDFPIVGRRQARQQTILFPWADRAAPRDMNVFDDAVEWLFSKIRDGKLVDTGCFASHGRTGTLLACMLVKKGMPALQARNQVRDKHCMQAIEGIAQDRFIYDYDELINGRPAPQLYPGQTRASQAIPPTTPPLSDEFGRRIAEPEPTEAELNNMNEAEAYEEWLRLNTMKLQDLAEEDNRLVCICAYYTTGCEVHTGGRFQYGAEMPSDEQITAVLDRQDWPDQWRSNGSENWMKRNALWCTLCDEPEAQCACTPIGGWAEDVEYY